MLVGSWAKIFHPTHFDSTVSSPVAWIIVPFLFKCAPLVWHTYVGFFQTHFLKLHVFFVEKNPFFESIRFFFFEKN